MSHRPDLRYVSFEGAPSRVPAGSSASDGRTLPAIRSFGASAPDVPGASASLDLARWVLAHAGLDASAYRTDSLLRRVPACLRALRARTAQEARRRIEWQPECLGNAVTALLIGATAFFRDPCVFEALRTGVVPALVEPGRRLRVWSAGCASGAEIYSFAMLLADAGAIDRVEMLGTDCRADAIAQARRAEYRSHELSDVGSPLFARYFEAASPAPLGLLRPSALPCLGWRPVERLRLTVRWRVADVLTAAEPGPWDVIFWRNSAIYLDADAAAGVYGRLVAQLAPGGYLVLGKAERPPASTGMRQVHRCIYAAPRSVR